MILTVHEMKRLARNDTELMALSAQLQHGGVHLELLTGICDPDDMRSMLCAVLAVAVQLDRDYIREKTLEGQPATAARGNHGGWPGGALPTTSCYSPARCASRAPRCPTLSSS